MQSQHRFQILQKVGVSSMIYFIKLNDSKGTLTTHAITLQLDLSVILNIFESTAYLISQLFCGCDISKIAHREPEKGTTFAYILQTLAVLAILKVIPLSLDKLRNQ